MLRPRASCRDLCRVQQRLHNLGVLLLQSAGDPELVVRPKVGQLHGRRRMSPPQTSVLGRHHLHIATLVHNGVMQGHHIELEAMMMAIQHCPAAVGVPLEHRLVLLLRDTLRERQEAG